MCALHFHSVIIPINKYELLSDANMMNLAIEELCSSQEEDIFRHVKWFYLMDSNVTTIEVWNIMALPPLPSGANLIMKLKVPFPNVCEHWTCPGYMIYSLQQLITRELCLGIWYRARSQMSIVCCVSKKEICSKKEEKYSTILIFYTNTIIEKLYYMFCFI